MRLLLELKYPLDLVESGLCSKGRGYDFLSRRFIQYHGYKHHLAVEEAQIHC